MRGNPAGAFGSIEGERSRFPGGFPGQHKSGDPRLRCHGRAEWHPVPSRPSCTRSKGERISRARRCWTSGLSAEKTPPCSTGWRPRAMVPGWSSWWPRPSRDREHTSGPSAVLYGGILLNGNHQLIDQMVRLIYGRDEASGRDTGTVSIFLRDARISTNIANGSAHRAVGTLVSQEVSRAVLSEGGRWFGRVPEPDGWHMAAYQPMRDHSGGIVGILERRIARGPVPRGAHRHDAHIPDRGGGRRARRPRSDLPDHPEHDPPARRDGRRQQSDRRWRSRSPRECPIPGRDRTARRLLQQDAGQHQDHEARARRVGPHPGGERSVPVPRNS